MTTALTHSPAEVMQSLLKDLGLATLPDQGLAWPAYSHGEPPKPDEVITVYDTVGIIHSKDAFGDVSEHYGIQVRVRSYDSTLGYRRTAVLVNALDKAHMKLTSVEDSSYLVWSVNRTGSVIPLGKGVDANRYVYTFNALVALTQQS